jgi:hypothetical protein
LSSRLTRASKWEQREPDAEAARTTACDRSEVDRREVAAALQTHDGSLPRYHILALYRPRTRTTIVALVNDENLSASHVNCR